MHQIGIDVGGTFTDLVVADSGSGIHTLKVLSTPDDYSRGILDGVAQMAGAGVLQPAVVMQSAGGVMKAATARQLPAYCIESGPAAGAVGAAALGRMLGISNIIAFDMGGTTAKACLIENGEPRLTDPLEVGAALNAGNACSAVAVMWCVHRPSILPRSAPGVAAWPGSTRAVHCA